MLSKQKVPSTVIVKLNVDFENREKKKVVRIYEGTRVSTSKYCCFAIVLEDEILYYPLRFIIYKTN